MKIYLSIFLLLTLVSCVPTSISNPYYNSIDEEDIPQPSVLSFPIDQTVEKLVVVNGPYPGLNYALGKVSSSDEVNQYVYNLPELGKVVTVEFYLKENRDYDWSFVIKFPKMKPEYLFKLDRIVILKNTRNKADAFKVISGPLEGACVADYSRFPEGFTSPGDRAIVILSKPKNAEVARALTGNCE